MQMSEAVLGLPIRLKMREGRGFVLTKFQSTIPYEGPNSSHILFLRGGTPLVLSYIHIYIHIYTYIYLYICGTGLLSIPARNISKKSGEAQGDHPTSTEPSWRYVMHLGTHCAYQGTEPAGALPFLSLRTTCLTSFGGIVTNWKCCKFASTQKYEKQNTPHVQSPESVQSPPHKA